MWGSEYWSGPWGFGPLAMIVCMMIAMAMCMGMMFFMMRGHGGRRSEDGRLGTLNERFARGEINRAEYEEGRRILGI